MDPFLSLAVEAGPALNFISIPPTGKSLLD
jgi:hypothetical protein